MTVISLATLEQICNRPLNAKNAREACKDLQGLARWWLRTEVLQKAHSLDDPTWEKLTNPQRPELSEDLGSCWIICRMQLADDPHRYFRNAVLLPLMWLEGRNHAVGLPHSLCSLADQVVDQVKSIKGYGDRFNRNWGLQYPLSLGMEIVLTEDLFESVDSGWASLASGLLAAGLQLYPKRTVWASVMWKAPGRVAAVDSDTLAEKLSLAEDWGATSFHVYYGQEHEANKNQSTITIRPLGSPSQEKPEDALSSLVADFVGRPEVPKEGPKEDDQFQNCANYYLFLPAFTEDSTTFYRTHLLEGIIRRCRIALQSSEQVSHFVTIVSKSPELAVISAKALNAGKCLLLHTHDLKQEANWCEQELGSESCSLGPLREGQDVIEEIAHLVKVFLEGAKSESVVFDLKPGTSKMKYSLIRAAPKGCRFLNLEPKFQDDRRNVPGTENPEILPSIK